MTKTDQEQEEQENKQLVTIKYKIKRAMKRYGCTLHEAEERVAQSYGLQVAEELYEPHPGIDWEIEYKEMVPLKERENARRLNSLGYDYASLWVTPVILRKSIADANAAIRYLFKANGFHDYGVQGQGVGSKVLKKVTLLGADAIETKISLYRPETKKGDPRLWVYGMKEFCLPGDELIFLFKDSELFVLNISRFTYDKLIDQLGVQVSETAKELLAQLEKYTLVPLPTPWRNGTKLADTDIGKALETALGIEANSSKSPDYKGIELKSFRKRKSRGNHHALFTQVPDWERSQCKSIADFVAKVGYPVRKKEVAALLPDTARELRCSVETTKPNSQGLQLVVDENADLVNEVLATPHPQSLLSWPGELLRERLKTKHPETFWIECVEVQISDQESGFNIVKIVYTSHPKLARFLTLIDQGFIRLDHMIGYKVKNGKAGLSEKGPSWKILSEHFAMLFPEPKELLNYKNDE